MEKARIIVGHMTQKLMDLVLLLWKLLSDLQQRSTKMKPHSEGGMEMGYDSLNTSFSSESSYVTAYSEFELECESPTIDDNTARLLEIDDKAFVVYCDNDHQTKEECYYNKENNGTSVSICSDYEEYSDNKENDIKTCEYASNIESRFTNSHEEIEDFGYESDSESHGSNSMDSDEDSQISDTYTAFDDVSDDDDNDDNVDECAPIPPIRITPIDRQMPVAEALRIVVLKQEAWKAMPYYYRQSRV